VRPLARLPSAPRQGGAIRRTKTDLELAASSKEILCSQPHDRISALLVVARANINVQDSLVCSLVSFLAAIKETHRRAIGPNRKISQPQGETPLVGRDPAKAGRGRDCFGQGAQACVGPGIRICRGRGRQPGEE
jgi:hypothetical protein